MESGASRLLPLERVGEFVLLETASLRWPQGFAITQLELPEIVVGDCLIGLPEGEALVHFSTNLLKFIYGFIQFFLGLLVRRVKGGVS